MILAFQLKSKKIEMILLLTAEYSLKTNIEEINMATTTMLSFNPFANIGEQIEYGALANSCGFGQENGKSSFACILSSYISQQQEIERLRKENEELKAHRPKHTCPQDEDLTGGDANYKYYFAHNEDGEMTIWKVPRHLDEVKSANPDTWDNAVQECFRNGKFGEEWDTLTYLIVREMKLKDLIKRKWTPKAEPQE